MPYTDIIRRCKLQERAAQKELYDMVSPLLFSICLRYLKTRETAEDALMEGFYKILTNMDRFKDIGSFEGWMKRIVVNECLMILRKTNHFHLSIESDEIDIKEDQIIESNMAYDELLEILNDLPAGYRTVFNMYAIEGYKHREIADILKISINTSKSQYLLAKKRFEQLVKKKQIIKAS